MLYLATEVKGGEVVSAKKAADQLIWSAALDK